MIFAYQILSMTNYCNLRCQYCDWKKEYGFALAKGQLRSARRNLEWSRQFADREYGDFLMGVYSGGEPFVFPELVEMFLDIYRDKWVRISTNGLFSAEKCLPVLRNHRRVILTASLDGLDLYSNRARFTGEAQLQTVLKNIEQALNSGILVMVLCTINQYNIDCFFDFTKGLYRLFRPYVELGRLVLPAHYITAYTTPVGIPTKSQEQTFIKRLRKEMDRDPLIAGVDWHYRELLHYIETKEHDDCQVDQWCGCAHFLEDEIVGDGRMHSYLCPMRGYGDLGVFDTEKPIEDFHTLYENERMKKKKSGEKCRCFVDWTAFDLVLNGKVGLERAADWFQFFREPEVKEWILKYKECHKIKGADNYE